MKTNAEQLLWYAVDKLQMQAEAHRQTADAMQQLKTQLEDIRDSIPALLTAEREAGAREARIDELEMTVKALFGKSAMIDGKVEIESHNLHAYYNNRRRQLQASIDDAKV